MRLRPRHYVLLVIIIGLFVYNIIRHRREEKNLASFSTTPAPVVINKPRLNTPAWAAYDQVASLRDAPASEYDAALKDLQTLLPLDPNPKDGHIGDIKGCLTWLEFYRQGTAQTPTDPQMKVRSTHHIENCVKYHLDTNA